MRLAKSSTSGRASSGSADHASPPQNLAAEALRTDGDGGSAPPQALHHPRRAPLAAISAISTLLSRRSRRERPHAAAPGRPTQRALQHGPPKQSLPPAQGRPAAQPLALAEAQEEEAPVADAGEEMLGADGANALSVAQPERAERRGGESDALPRQEQRHQHAGFAKRFSLGVAGGGATGAIIDADGDEGSELSSADSLDDEAAPRRPRASNSSSESRAIVASLLRTVLGGRRDTVEGASDGAGGAGEYGYDCFDARLLWELRQLFGVLHPNSATARRWQRLVFVFALVVTVEAPYTASFLYTTPTSIATLAICTDIVFFVDVLVKCATGFVSEDANAVVLDVRQIVRAYAESWLALDVLAAVPWQLVATIVDAAGGADYYTFLRAARVTHCAKMPVVLFARRKADLSNGALVVSLMIAYFVALYWFTCLQWALPRSLGYPEESWVRQTRTIDLDVPGQLLQTAFNAVSQMGTISYGNYEPSTRQELITSMLNIVFGAAAFGLMVGAISISMASTDSCTRTFNDRLEAINQFLAISAIPVELRKRVRAHLFADFPSGRLFDETQVMAMLPFSLQRDLLLVRARTLYQKVPLFREAGMTFMMQVAQHLRPLNALPGEYLVHEGEKLTKVLFIDEGVVQVLVGREMRLVAELSDGAFIGEVSAIHDSFAVATVRVTVHAVLFLIEASAFRTLLQSFPDVRVAIMRVIHMRHKMREDSARGALPPRPMRGPGDEPPNAGSGGRGDESGRGQGGAPGSSASDDGVGGASETAPPPLEAAASDWALRDVDKDQVRTRSPAGMPCLHSPIATYRGSPLQVRATGPGGGVGLSARPHAKLSRNPPRHTIARHARPSVPSSVT
jgi:hypothetical protein